MLLVNGRISDRSVSRYRTIKPFMRRVLKDISFCCMQTELDRDRLLSLGVDPGKVEVAGNLKYEIAAPSSIEAKTEDYRQLLGLSPNRFVVVAGSTMKDEEPLVLAAFETLRAVCSEAVLVIAPRHPERFREVEKLLSDRSVEYVKRSDLKPGTQGACQERPGCAARLPWGSWPPCTPLPVSSLSAAALSPQAGTTFWNRHCSGSRFFSGRA